jgi:hypothetical protein
LFVSELCLLLVLARSVHVVLCAVRLVQLVELRSPAVTRVLFCQTVLSVRRETEAFPEGLALQTKLLDRVLLGNHRLPVDLALLSVKSRA